MDIFSCSRVSHDLIACALTLESLSFGAATAYEYRCNPLAHNTISAHALAPALRGLLRLNALDLSACSVAAAELAILGPALSCIPCLKSLSLADNNFGPPSFTVVASITRSIPKLEQLELGGNRPDATSFAALSESFSHLPRLSSLGIRGIGGTLLEAGCVALAGLLHSAPSLRYLDIRCHDMAGEGLRVMTDAFAGMPFLEELRIGECSLYNHPMPMPYAALYKVPHLRKLVLYSVHFFMHSYSGGAASVSPGQHFASFPALESLDVTPSKFFDYRVMCDILACVPRLRSLRCPAIADELRHHIVGCAPAGCEVIFR
jgi:hypothetical protein